MKIKTTSKKPKYSDNFDYLQLVVLIEKKTKNTREPLILPARRAREKVSTYIYKSRPRKIAAA